MGRPRKHNLHLPESVYFRNGAYYRVVDGVWYRLGKTLPENWDADPTLTLSPKQAEVATYAESLATATIKRAERTGLECTITAQDVHALMVENRFRCAVSRTPFSLEVVSGRRPFAPSIDRISASQGYTRGNCRVVCLAVNLAMNVWGDAVLRRLFVMKRTKKKRRVLDAIGSSKTPIGEKMPRQ